MSWEKPIIKVSQEVLTMLKKTFLHKNLFYSSLFAVFSILFLIGSMFVNRGYFEALSYDNVFLYEGKQLLCIVVLFFIGAFFLSCCMQKLSGAWILCFSFPIGCCIWTFVSLILLLLGIPYTLWITSACIAAFLAAVLFLHRPAKENLKKNPIFSPEALPFLFCFFGIACIASSGFLYKFVSYDSYFYFTNYGHTLAEVNNFQDLVGANSFTLTNISQFLPLLNAYTSFWGLDQCFQIQAFLTADTAVCFAYALSLYAQQPEASCSPKYAWIYSGVFTLLLLSSTSFITVSSWVLANMYCMVYLFLAFLVSFLLCKLSENSTDCLVLISFFLTALTQLRKDGIIFAAFLLICFRSAELFSKKQSALLFLPAVISEALWLFYVRVILNAQVAQASYSSIANNKNIFFVCAVIAGTCCYLFFAHDVILQITKKIPALTEYMILLAGMSLLFLASFVLKDADTIIDNVDFVIRNMFRYPSSWGISGLIFGILIVLSVINRFELDYFQFIWCGYAFLNLISYCIVDSKWFWLNWDDSYNRVLLQIVPVFVFAMAVKILPLLRPCIPDHSSES